MQIHKLKFGNLKRRMGIIKVPKQDGDAGKLQNSITFKIPILTAATGISKTSVAM